MLVDALARWAVDRGSQPAVICRGESRTWRELAERAATIVSRRGDLVPVQYPNSLELVENLLAALRHGARALLLNADWPPAEADRYGGKAAPIAGSVLLCTSGTTGDPKIVGRSERQLLALGAAYANAVALTPDDRIYCAVPMTHGQGLCAGLLAALASGAALHISPAFDRRSMLRDLRDDAITVLMASPFQYGVLARTAAREGFGGHKLRYCFSGGDGVDEVVWQDSSRSLGIEVRQTYGCTETGMLCANVSADARASRHTVGSALLGAAIEIRDRIIHGKGVSCEDWIETGDFGSVDESGRLTVSGRKPDIYNIAGRKSNPGEFRSVLLTHPLVVDVHWPAVNEPAIAICRKPCAADELVAYCRERIAAYKLPRLIKTKVTSQ